LNALLIKTLDFERWLVRWMNLPFGVSIVCTARKPAGEVVKQPVLASAAAVR
jgi:hypothetical protein